MTHARRKVVVEPNKITVDGPNLPAHYEVSGVWPVQAEGTVRGQPLYFRAKHDEWSFEVAGSDGHLSYIDGNYGPDEFVREGEYFEAGRMPFEDAVEIINRCLGDYLAERCR